MMLRPLSVTSILIIGIIHHGLGTDDTNFTLCDVPPVGEVWEFHRTEPLEIEWGYGKMTCNTATSCFHLNVSKEILMVPQIMPVVVQQGTKISFMVSPSMSVGFSMTPYMVTEEGFRECSFSKGRPLVETDVTSIEIEDYHLSVGQNYFIAKTNDSLFQCRLGLRLNVTVKPNHCSPSDIVDNCNNRGHCVTQLHDKTYTCSCCPGARGRYCEDTDACYSAPCLNGATCTNNGTDYSCSCILGYTGDHCEEKLENLCDLNPCKNQGTCIGNDTSYICKCPPGFQGLTCEEDINECASNPCSVHGLCKDLVNGFQCYCLPGTGGERCEVDYDECVSSPCKNHGKCVDKLNSWECQCGRGYTGSDCSVKVDLCKPNPCAANATCVDRGNTHQCLCQPGFSGKMCDVDINECLSHPCLYGATCQDIVDGYVCHCAAPYVGRNCHRHSIPNKIPTPADDSHFHLPALHSTHYHLHNLYIIMGTLGGALLIALLVLLGCYCRLYRTYELLDWRKLKYQRYKDEKIDISSVTCPRPSVDAIYEATTINYGDNSMNTPVPVSLKPKKV
ncbi:delta and Notch-like epidermal growth factor-related receptor [Lineus longissimus]|uniref:delta and Notch-like epidermal growth factor-related receptor n=1 Tax=Lineus longissimus TaxID=88925 RepID=UPI002B4DE4AA